MAGERSPEPHPFLLGLQMLRLGRGTNQIQRVAMARPLLRDGPA